MAGGRTILDGRGKDKVVRSSGDLKGEGGKVKGKREKEEGKSVNNPVSDGTRARGGSRELLP
jgi:hypothetical protein